PDLCARAHDDGHPRASRSAGRGRGAARVRRHLRPPAWADPPVAALLQHRGGDGPRARAACSAARRRDAGLTPTRLRLRIVLWSAVIGLLAANNYAARLGGLHPPDDLLFRWSTAVVSLILYAILAVALLLIARGIPLRDA